MIQVQTADWQGRDSALLEQSGRVTVEMLAQRDLHFLAEMFFSEYRNKETAAEKIRTDNELTQAMLDDDRLFQRLMSDEQVLLQISPWLFFNILLRRARRDLSQETFTIERRSQQQVLLFDTNEVVQLLQREAVPDYLAALLASFTRVESVTVSIQVRGGLWRRYRTNDLDVEGLIRHCHALDEEARFSPYKRIADVCLFLTGMFPEFIEAQYRYPKSRGIRPQMRSSVCQTREDYESVGRAFYSMAAEHPMAHETGLTEVLATLSDRFVLAEKPLAVLSDRYLRFTKRNLFDL